MLNKDDLIAQGWEFDGVFYVHEDGWEVDPQDGRLFNAHGDWCTTVSSVEELTKAIGFRYT